MAWSVDLPLTRAPYYGIFRRVKGFCGMTMRKATRPLGRPKGEAKVDSHYRLRASLVERVRALAEAESRPLSRQVELLLERALA